MELTALSFALALLEAVPALLSAATATAETWNSLVSTVRQMQAEKRDPTDAEWAELNSLTSGLIARLD